MIKVENVSFSYDKKNTVISNINFAINDGETVGIIGANGAGKSTILKLLVGLESNNQGKIIIGDLKVEKNNLTQIRQNVGYVFQDPDNQLFMTTVYEDVAFAPKNYKFSAEEVQKRTIKSLQRIGIEELKDKPIYQLSGGQKKLVAIATVLSMEPDILIFDEPTIALDRRRFINLVQTLQGTKIIASHDLDLIYDTCDKVILIANGKIVVEGQTKPILENQDLLENNGLELPLSLSRK